MVQYFAPRGVPEKDDNTFDHMVANIFGQQTTPATDVDASTSNGL